VAASRARDRAKLAQIRAAAAKAVADAIVKVAADTLEAAKVNVTDSATATNEDSVKATATVDDVMDTSNNAKKDKD
jgi:hypothetical protein